MFERSSEKNKIISSVCSQIQNEAFSDRSFLVVTVSQLWSQYFCSGQRKLEEFQNHLDEESGRRDEAEEQLEGSTKILLKVRSGIEHLSEKLKHLKAVSTLHV